jgi:hypothetical protein
MGPRECSIRKTIGVAPKRLEKAAEVTRTALVRLAIPVREYRSTVLTIFGVG